MTHHPLPRAEGADDLIEANMPSYADMSLHLGEMTKQEMRTARAAYRFALSRLLPQIALPAAEALTVPPDAEMVIYGLQGMLDQYADRNAYSGYPSTLRNAIALINSLRTGRAAQAAEPVAEEQVCPDCGGLGRFPPPFESGGDCDGCNGSGHVPAHPAPASEANAEGVIEAMARAMCEKDGFDWDASSCHHTANGEEPEQQREYWRDKAEAAFAALAARQPADTGVV